jgi:cation:H+ antiporter
MTTLLLILGIMLLAAGGESLVRGAARLAAASGMSPLVIGLTVVGYGTSAPELAVGVRAALAGKSELVTGDVVGASIFNILFTLGLCAMFRPVTVAVQLVRLDVPIMIGTAVAVWLLSLNGVLSRREGVLLASGIVVYTIYTVRRSRGETRAAKHEFKEEFGAQAAEEEPDMRFWLTQIALLIVGVTMLVLGARWVVAAAVAIARAVGVSELVIGLTIVAAGTGLPEFAASFVATVRQQRDIAIGNLIGSNIFNLTWVLGVACIFAPQGIHVPPAALRFDLPVLIAVALACLPIFFRKHLIARWEGALFVAYYMTYVTYIVLAAREHDALGLFSDVMLWFVIPLTAITVAVLLVREFRLFSGIKGAGR